MPPHAQLSSQVTLPESPRIPWLPAVSGLLKPAALRVAPWLALLAIWALARIVSARHQELVPSFSSVLQQGLDLARDGSLGRHWLASTARVLAGVLLGVSLAVPAGFLLGWYSPVRRALTPVLNFFRALPPIALIPLMIVYFGIGEAAKITVLFYAAFLTSVVVIYEGIAQINPLYLNVARALGASDRELFTRVVVPLALPHVLTATRVALGISWMTLVASEMIAAQQGLGALIQVASSYFQLDIIYLGIGLIGITATLMDVGLSRLGARLVHWQERIKP
jgi:NitT/TauT family transport system permease protein